MQTVVVLDNDETTGYYHHYFDIVWWVINQGTCSLTYDELVEMMLIHCRDCRVFRPGLQNFLENIQRLKLEGKVDKVVIYTNYYCKDVSTQYDVNYVELLTSCLTKLSGLTFDYIFTREEIHKENHYPPKTLNRLREHFENARFIFYEDRPEAVNDVREYDLLVRVPTYVSPINYYFLKKSLQEIYDTLTTDKSFTAIIHEVSPWITNNNLKKFTPEEDEAMAAVWNEPPLETLL